MSSHPTTPRFVLEHPRVPRVPDYCVLTTDRDDVELSALLVAAVAVAQREAQRRFGDPQCFTLLCNAQRTRRQPWPHVHIVLAPSVAAKRRALWWLSIKHFSRPWRWPLVRRIWPR